MCDYKVEDSITCFIGKCVIQNVVGEMLHSPMIYNGYVFFTITKSHKDDYFLFDPLNGDNLPIITIGTAKKHFCRLAN